mgnify:CR=1 FL=1
MRPDHDPESEEHWFIGVDVGGTSIKLGAATSSGEIVSETSIPTHDELGPTDAIRRICETLKLTLGVAVEKVLKDEPGYYAWMMKGDFPLYTKKILTEIRLRSFNQK